MKSNTNKVSNQHDVDRGVRSNETDIYMSNQRNNDQTPLSAATNPVGRKGPVATSTKQMAGYFTVSGIENEISITENEWPCFALKELSDNAYDWLNDYYPITIINNRHNSSINYNRRTSRYIAIRIQIDEIPNDPDLTRVFRIAVRNSNVDQIEVFGQCEGLEQIFDYTQWLSTKRYQHRMTAGSLGDYLKRHGGMGYASWNNIARSSSSIGYEDSDSDDNIQWEEPLIFRFNGSEYKVFVYYDRYKGLPESIVKYAGKSNAIDYTEVECALPVSRINCNGNDSNPVPPFDKLYEYYTWYKIPKADIKFSLDMRYDIRHITEEDG